MSELLRGLECDRGGCACHASARRGRGLTHCPAHEDRTPSLSVFTGREGAPAWSCKAGCKWLAVTEALEERGLVHSIRHENGRLDAVHERKGKWVGADGRVGLNGRSPKDMLYGIERLASAKAGHGVVLVEGEKAAVALCRLEIVAVATVCGAATTPSTAALQPLVGRPVVLWPDADDAGRQHMSSIAEVLAGLGVEARIVEWAGAPEHGDAADYVEHLAGADEEERRAGVLAFLRSARKPVNPISNTGFTGFTRTTGWTAAELMAVEFPPPKWAVDELIPEGLTIFAGRPKIGKSWLVLGLAVAIASGGRALGRVKVVAGDVLYLALEDSGRRLQSRLAAILGTSPGPARLRLETTWPRSNEGGVDRLRQWLEAHPEARFVIVDTLARFRPVTREAGYSQDYAAIEPLQALASEFGVAIIIVHHQRKVDAHDWVDTISGTLGLAGAADGMIAIFRDRDVHDAIVRVTGRDIEDGKHGLRWTPATASWSLTADLPMHPERQRIVDLVREAGPLGPTEVARRLGKPVGTVKVLMRRMEDVDQLVSSDGTYAAPGQALMHVDPVIPIDPVNPVNPVNPCVHTLTSTMDGVTTCLHCGEEV